jgi:hypothetical protein
MPSSLVLALASREHVERSACFRGLDANGAGDSQLRHGVATLARAIGGSGVSAAERCRLPTVADAARGPCPLESRARPIMASSPEVPPLRTTGLARSRRVDGVFVRVSTAGPSCAEKTLPNMTGLRDAWRRLPVAVLDDTRPGSGTTWDAVSLGTCRRRFFPREGKLAMSCRTAVRAPSVIPSATAAWCGSDVTIGAAPQPY